MGFRLSDCGRYGASTDGLTDSNEPVEIKAPDLHTFLKWIREYETTGEVPREHKVQCHGEMLVCESNVCHFVAYADCEFIDNLKIEVPRSSFTDTLKGHVEKFCDMLEETRRARLGDFYDEFFDGKGAA